MLFGSASSTNIEFGSAATTSFTSVLKYKRCNFAPSPAIQLKITIRSESSAPSAGSGLDAVIGPESLGVLCLRKGSETFVRMDMSEAIWSNASLSCAIKATSFRERFFRQLISRWRSEWLLSMLQFSICPLTFNMNPASILSAPDRLPFPMKPSAILLQ